MKLTFYFLISSFLIVQAQNPGIKLSYIDSSAKPTQDFYGFCNGKWHQTFVLPESDARYGSFNEINDANLVKIKLILQEASKNTKALPNTNAQRLRDFYNTAMDSVRIDGMGFQPIIPQLNQIDAIQTLADFMKVKTEFENIGINLLFGSGVSPDLKNSKKNTFGISQAGYGLGDRDYYFNKNNERIREEYKIYLGALFEAIGTDESTSKQYAQQVLDFETQLVNKAFTRVQMRDIEKMYNVYTIKMLNDTVPKINWAEYNKTKKIKTDTVIVGMVEYMKEINKLLDKTPINILKIYSKAQLIMEAAPYLNNKMLKTHFRFRGQVLSGSKIMKPRWQRVQNVMNGSIGDIVSEEFVKKYFPVEAKVKINVLIDNLIFAYRERIATRTWMSAETKKEANRKLDLLIRKVGFPDKFKDYSALSISTNSYWENVCRANTFLNEDNLNDLKKPVDRSKWQMTAVTVNAYYDPTTNEITFPAAILQPPFYDPTADDAANYGTMGSIIGHELTHGFDDQGAQFDADGNMKMWWTENDFKNFKERTEKIVIQYNKCIALDTLRINGEMTQGENIADLGGLTMSYYAYKKSLGNKPSKKIGGFTGEQRFFIAWAQGWKSVTRPEELKRLLTVDFHSPARFRAFVPLTNMKEFYDAFKVTEYDKMYVIEGRRVEIW